MTDLERHCHELQKVWDEHFPMVRAMGVKVGQYDNHTLTTHTPLVGNTNIHGTAFAGSLYAIEALTAWGLLYLEIAMAGLDASIIHAAGNIEFSETVNGEIVAVSRLGEHTSAMEELAANGKIRLELASEVITEGRVASRFRGDYAVRLDTR